MRFGTLVEPLSGTTCLTVKLAFLDGPTIRFRLEAGRTERSWATAVQSHRCFGIVVDERPGECVRIDLDPWDATWTDHVWAFTPSGERQIRKQ